jgi:hypothetical protein
MGADGPGLFSDDTACDVRDEYREALEDGATDAEAESRVLREFADDLDDPDERIVVWLALAFTQSKHGRLSGTTRREVLAVLDAGGDLERWREAGPGAVRRRAAVLERVRAQVEGPQPAPRKVRRHRPPVSSLAAGQVLGYRARSGRLHLMRVVAVDVGRQCVDHAIRFMAYAEPELPDPATLATIRDRHRRPGWKKVHLRIDDDPRDRERAGIVVVGAVPEGVPEVEYPKAAESWAGVAAYLESCDSLLEQAPS